MTKYIHKEQREKELKSSNNEETYFGFFRFFVLVI